jgi:PIN domain nuclease of toxin-antitoxin system
MKSYVIDTHALIWFLTGNKNLSDKSRKILLNAQIEEARILISSIVLAEILYILNKKKINLNINELLDLIAKSTSYKIVPFDLPVFKEMLELPGNLEMHDRIIAATSIYYKSPLITKDRELHRIKTLRIIW